MDVSTYDDRADDGNEPPVTTDRPIAANAALDEYVSASYDAGADGPYDLYGRSDGFGYVDLPFASMTLFRCTTSANALDATSSPTTAERI